MSIQKIKIGGVVYGNVGDIDTDRDYEYVYKVRTLDGILHEKIRYTTTVHTVQFFNLLDGVYDSLKSFVKANKGVAIECGIPTDNGTENDFENALYYITIKSEINKGYHNGVYFRNGLTLELEAVSPDE